MEACRKKEKTRHGIETPLHRKLPWVTFEKVFFYEMLESLYRSLNHSFLGLNLFLFSQN